MVAERGLEVEIRGDASGKALGLPVTPQALNWRFAAALSFVQVQVIEGAAHALLDIEDLADWPFGPDAVEGIGFLPIWLAELELDIAHVPGLPEHGFERGTDLLIGLTLRHDHQGMEMEVGNAALALFAPPSGRYGLKVDQALPVHALVMEAPIEEPLDVAVFCRHGGQVYVDTAVNKHRALTIERDHGRCHVSLFQNVCLLFPDRCLQVIEATCGSNDIPKRFPLIWVYLSLRR